MEHQIATDEWSSDPRHQCESGSLHCSTRDDHVPRRHVLLLAGVVHEVDARRETVAYDDT
jgi:hypothetical protein